MPTYLYKCTCGEHIEVIAKEPLGVACNVCGKDMARNYSAEGSVSTFHMTRDLYAEKKKQDARKRK
jgi:predicted nucleic acid-binding Zn ribbon protein